MDTLDLAVQNLDNLTELLPALERLGTIHANIGIKKEQFAVSNASSSRVMIFFFARKIRHMLYPPFSG